MISLSSIHESRGGAVEPQVAGCRVFAVGTGERRSLARVAGEAAAEGCRVIIRCCCGSLAADGHCVVVGSCLEWEEGANVRIEESPVQAIAVMGRVEGCEQGCAAVHARGTKVAQAFDDVAVAWLAGDDKALASRVSELVARCWPGGEKTRVVATRRKIAYRAREAMERHVLAPLTIAQLALECATSPTVLKESFRDEFGVPVYEWYRRLRMLRAADLLGEGTRSVGEVAREVGYANASKFARAFTDCMGVSPSVFRQP